MVFNVQKSEILCDAIRGKNKCRNDEWDEYKKIQDSNAADAYQSFLCTILEKAENIEPHKRVRENTVDIHQEDDCSNHDDPQCAIFLGSLKPHGKSYVLESNKHGAPSCVKYEVESGSKEENETVRTRKKSSGVALDLHANHTYRPGSKVRFNLGDDQIGSNNKDKVQKVVRFNLDDDQIGQSKKDEVQKTVKGKNVVQKPGPSSKEVQENEHERVDRAQARGKDKIVTTNHKHVSRGEVVIKEKNSVRKEVEASKKALVEMGNEHLYQKPGSRSGQLKNNHCADIGPSQPGKKVEVQCSRKPMEKVKEEEVDHEDNGLSNPKAAFGTSKNQLDCDLRARSGRKGEKENSSKDKAVVVIKEEKEGDAESVSDVEILDILDSRAIQIRGVLSSFDPSTRFLRSDDEDSQDLVHDEFRNRILEVLNKPFDKEELRRHREAVKAGDYYTHYPDFVKKLNKYRYNRRKCLAILRGFFFWLQNVCKEGSFKPWKDGECLKVEPQYA